MTDRALLDEAIRAAALAWAPYSGFHVGAALLAASGKIYRGANIENASYGVTVCAERTALWQAVLAGERQFAALAVAAVGQDGNVTGAPPCGVCRQALSEFDDGSLRVLFGSPDDPTVCTLRELLPHSFGAAQL